MTKTVWTVDHVHSEVGFSVKHMMISKAKGTFEKFDAVIEADLEDFSNANIEVKVETASINTRNEDRDNHLRSADFFDSENFPHMTFKATDVEKVTSEEYRVSGNLTIKETTKPVTLDVTFEGVSKNPMTSATTAGFSGSTVINRKEFGLTWNAAVETGGVLVGEDVKINFELEVYQEA